MNNNPWDVLAASITRLKDKVDAYPSVREATMHGVAPLSVMFDTDTQPTSVHGSLASNPVVGDRVLTLKLSHYVWILGIKGGQAPPLPIQPASQAEANAGSISDKYISPKTLRETDYRPFAEAAGVVTTGSGYATVTYPVNRFTQRPVLGLTVRSTSANDVGVTWQEQGSATAASFKVIIFTIAGSVTSGQVEWSARQMTPTSAQG